MKKILTAFLTLCFFANISFAFDPYANDEVEKKSYKKLYYGIVLTLVGGFLAYDGFSIEEVDISKPSVDCTTVLHSEWVQQSGEQYLISSGVASEGTGDYKHYEIEGHLYEVKQNVLYNNGNVNLKNLTIEVRYKCENGDIIGPSGNDGYHTVRTIEELKKGTGLSWQDVWSYIKDTGGTPTGKPREPYTKNAEGVVINDGTTGLNLGKKALSLMDIRIRLNKNQQYKPIYEKRYKSEIEGIAGILVGLAGIYLIVDHFVDMHKFNVYAKKHNLNFKIATASNEYKLMLQKRI